MFYLQGRAAEPRLYLAPEVARTDYVGTQCRRCRCPQQGLRLCRYGAGRQHLGPEPHGHRGAVSSAPNSDYEIETWISGYNRLLSTRNFRIYDEEGRQFATMTSMWAMLNVKTRSAVDLTRTADVHDKYMVQEEPPCAAPCRLRGVSGGEEFRHTVRYSDIDFNRHMNTIRYVEMIFDHLPIEAIAEDRPFRLDLHFLREAVLGEVLTIATVEEEGRLLFEISTPENPCVRAALSWL
ncbi:MAG: acyl-ACP thioesterase [Alistipes sp.]|nr:acyl-ACP thioesterase [Alistipes sp.]